MFGTSFAAIDISSSGLAAERYRMEIIANNIANAYSTSTANGQGPYRRQGVVFSSAVDQATQGRFSVASGGPQLGGVRVSGLVSDDSDFPRVYNPGHPHADSEGMVAMPNVSMPHEMVDLLTASRAYEANLRSLRTFREMAQQTMSLLRGMGS